MVESVALTPCFDSLSNREIVSPSVTGKLSLISIQNPDCYLFYDACYEYLENHQYNANNYSSYRTECTCFFNWAFLVAKKSPFALKRNDIHKYIDYCMAPPKEEISGFNRPQFITDKETGYRVFNPKWKQFRLHKKGKYLLSTSSLKTKIAILSSLYTFCMEEGLTETNPALAVLKHNRLKDNQSQDFLQYDIERMKAFSQEQLNIVLTKADELAKENPLLERELFIIRLLYGCYLRISEIASRPSFYPTMNLFRQDTHSGAWLFFVPKSKGNKSRAIPLSDSLLDALKRYRKALNYQSELPTTTDYSPLFPSKRAIAKQLNIEYPKQTTAHSPSIGIRQIRKVVMDVFEQAAISTTNEHDAAAIMNQTTHSLRHSGISDDININKRELNHVREDAGHGSFTTTSMYSHTSRKDRHLSAKNKKIL